MVVDTYGVPCHVADLEALIGMRRFARPPKDFAAIAELELLRDRAPKPEQRG